MDLVIEQVALLVEGIDLRLEVQDTLRIRDTFLQLLHIRKDLLFLLRLKSGSFITFLHFLN